MTQADMVIRLLLAVLYCTAALAKFTTPQSTRRALESFDLAPRLRPAVQALPLAELAIAGCLLFSPTYRFAAASSCLLLIVFSSVAGRSMRRGSGGSCNCFGRLHATPIGWSLLARNGVLFMASAAVAVTSKAGNPLRLGQSQGATVVTLGAVTVVSGVLSWALLYRPAARGAARQDAGSGLADDRHRRLQLGQYYPTLEGKGGVLANFFPGATNALLVFVDPQCGPCKMLLPVLERLSGSFQEMQLLVVTRGATDTIKEVMGGLPPGRVVIDTDGALAAQAAVPGTPAAVVVALPTATVISMAVGPVDIEALLALGPPAEPAHRQMAPAGSMPRGPRLLSESGLNRALKFSRRDALGIGAGAGLLAVVGAGGTADASSLSSGSISTGCPTCGDCTICDMTTPASCRPCAQACSTHKLCEQYANKYAPYTTIQAYLHEHGYRPSGQAKALGLQYNGTLEVFGTYLEFQGATASEGALLFYGLTNNGETAVATIFDKPKHVSSVVGTSPSGTVVVQEVPAVRTTTTSSAAGDGPKTAEPFPGDTVAADIRLPEDSWQCSNYCTWISTAVMALPFFVAVPEALAGLVEGAIMNEVLLYGSGQVAIYTIKAAVQSSAIANVLWALGKKAVTNTLCASVVCPLIKAAKTKFEYCCNYDCKCYDLQSACFAACPLDIAHPLADCYVYRDEGQGWKQISGVPTKCKP